ncbi:MAG: IS1 family transposase [Okeania sp. SIO2D1]|nr:IS1 family transposase [Okeania sp. SIO2D1]
MKCPKCNSTQTRKNGRRRGQQCFQCRICGRQFVESPKSQPYSPQIKELCLKMYLNGMGLRAIQRVTEVHHTTIIKWIKDAGIKLPDAPEEQEIPEITEIDELQTFIGHKKHKVWIWTVVNHWKPGILLWVVGDRSSKTFEYLWLIIRCWHSFWYVSDGYCVYPCFIAPEDHLVSKTYMTRVEGENTRLRHYLARLHRKTLCYSRSLEMLKYSIRLLLHYLKFETLPISA